MTTFGPSDESEDDLAPASGDYDVVQVPGGTGGPAERHSPMPSMPRRISVEITSSMTDAQYADLANAIWMTLRLTGHEYDVHQDQQADHHDLNAAWEQYGKDARWRGRA